MERLKLDDFRPKQTREGANFACGYMWEGKQRCGNKKNYILGGIIFLLSVFSVHQGAVNQPTLHVGLKDVFCERDGWVNVGEKCYQFFHPL